MWKSLLLGLLVSLHTRIFLVFMRNYEAKSPLFMIKRAGLNYVPRQSYSKNSHGSYILKWIRLSMKNCIRICTICMNSEVPIKYYFDRMWYTQWVEKWSVHPLQLFSFFFFALWKPTSELLLVTSCVTLCLVLNCTVKKGFALLLNFNQEYVYSYSWLSSNCERKLNSKMIQYRGRIN